MFAPTTLERLVRRAAACLAALLASVTLALGACSAPDPRARPVLLTTADFASMAVGAPADAAVTPGYGLPGGMLLKNILELKGDKATPTLALRETLTEGYRSEYVTTEIWAGFPAVWVQPVYVPVMGYAA